METIFVYAMMMLGIFIISRSIDKDDEPIGKAVRTA